MDKYRWKTYGQFLALAFKGKRRRLSDGYGKELAAFVYPSEIEHEYRIDVYTPDGVRAFCSSEHMSLDQCKDKCLTLAMLYGW